MPAALTQFASPPLRFRFWVILALIPAVSLTFSFHLTSFLLAKWAVFSLACILLAATFAWERRFPRDGILAFLPLWALLFWGLLVHVVAAHAVVVHFSIEAFAQGFLYLVFAAFAFVTLRDERYLGKMRDTVQVSIAFAAGLGLLQFADFLEPIFPRVEGFNQPMYGVLGNQGLFAGFVAIGVPLATQSLLVSRRIRALDMACLAMILPAWVIAGSRSAWLAGVAATLIALPYTAIQWRRVLALGGIGGAALLALCVAFPDDTISRVVQTLSAEDIGGRSRTWYWAGAARMVRDHWILGVGAGNYQFESPKYQGDVLQAAGGEGYLFSDLQTINVHCDPSEVLAEYGVVGLVCLLWMSAKLIKRRDSPEWGPLCAVVIFSTMFPTWGSPAHIVVGLLMAAGLMARNASDDQTLLAKRTGGAFDALLLSIVTVGAATFICWAMVYPDYLIRRARQEEAAGRDALELYRRAAEYPWPKPYAREEFGIQLFALARYDDAFKQFSRASYGVDTGDIHQWLAATYEERGEPDKAYTHWKACIWRWPYDEYAWGRLLALSPPEDIRGNRLAITRWLSQSTIEDLLRR